MVDGKKAEWCIVRLDSDMNWWVMETNWLPPASGEEGLGILDPNQVEHIFDLLEPMREYGLQPDTVERAFLRFAIDKDLGNGNIRLVAFDAGFDTNEEKLFALPMVSNDSSGGYAEFLEHISVIRVKMLNATERFSQKITLDDLDDAVAGIDDITPGTTHAFQEILAILEYHPFGVAASSDDDEDDDDDEWEMGLSDGQTIAAINEVSESTAH
ncbi:MAG: hypothetical protein LBI34_01620 [Puniceicoccales bacterium]|jgi:hypothetical protein|nr:hypothetical protein [Puniceicoccales bacterium]